MIRLISSLLYLGNGIIFYHELCPGFAASELHLRSDKFEHQKEKWNVTVCKSTNVSESPTIFSPSRSINILDSGYSVVVLMARTVEPVQI
jgi:hypothetical protein